MRSETGLLNALCRSAKEVRRMIREASYDSLLSELGAALSVSEGDNGAYSTEGMLDRLEGDLSDLRRVLCTCDIVEKW